MLIRLVGLASAVTPARLTLEPIMSDETAVQRRGPGWGTFQCTVGGLVAVIAVLVGVIYNDMRSSIKETADGLSTFKVEVARQLSDLRLELAAVKAEVGTANAKLDKVIDRLDRVRTQ